VKWHWWISMLHIHTCIKWPQPFSPISFYFLCVVRNNSFFSLENLLGLKVLIFIPILNIYRVSIQYIDYLCMGQKKLLSHGLCSQRTQWWKNKKKHNVWTNKCQALWPVLGKVPDKWDSKGK
jgi:hypothetical protein